MIWLLLVACGLASASLSSLGIDQHRVGVIVTSETGVPAARLQAQDFVIRVGDSNREVLRAEPATGPVAVVLVADVALADVPQSRAALDTVVEMLRRHDDRSRVALTRLAEPAVALTPVADGEAVSHVRGHLVGTGYDLLPGIVEAARSLATAPEQRRVVLAITRSRRRDPGLTAAFVSQAVRKSGATLFGVEIGPLTAGTGTTDAEKVMARVTTLSGGRRARISDTLSLESTVREMVAQMLSQYVVTYAGPVSAESPIRVGVRRDHARVYARAWPPQ